MKNTTIETTDIADMKNIIKIATAGTISTTNIINALHQND